MEKIKHYLLFLQIYMKQDKRKWLSFPLILLSPIIIIGASLFLTAKSFETIETEPIKIDIVNEDQSEELNMLLGVLIEAQEEFTNYIEMNEVNRTTAQKNINHDEISSYIVFPENFIEDLFYGEQVKIDIVGNKAQRIQSIMVKEIMDSVMRHINTSQANIILLNNEAKRFMEDSNERNDYLFEQFINYFTFVLSKDKIVTSETVDNIATSSLETYYTISGMFILMIVWLWIIYLFLYRDETKKMEDRIYLYGITKMDQLLAKGIISFVLHMILWAILWLFIQVQIIPLSFTQFWHILFVYMLFGLIVLTIFSILELLIHSMKVRMFIQLILVIVIIFASGAIVPSIYFPLDLQTFLPYIFSYETLYLLQEIIMEEYVGNSYIPLLTMLCMLLVIFICISWWKGRKRL